MDSTERLISLHTATIVPDDSDVWLEPFTGFDEAEKAVVWYDPSQRPEVTEFHYENKEIEYDPANVELFIDFVVSSPDYAYFGIYDRRHGLIGQISINALLDEEIVPHVGILVGEPDLWGQGIGATAVQALLSALDSFGYPKVQAYIRTENIRSRKLFAKFGHVSKEDRKIVILDIDTKP